MVTVNVLLVGGSGFLGKALTPFLLAKGHRVYSLSRHPPAPADNLIPLDGDILLPNLGLKEVPDDISAVHHLAAIHRLDESKAAETWETNVLGTENVVLFCEEHKIPHLFFTSTAYVCGRNSYERSKSICESMVMRSAISKKTIFKPSIIMPTENQAYFGHFIQFALLVVKVHQRAEMIRRYLEGELRLPVLRPSFRVLGNPDGYLNLVALDDVVTAMAEIEDEGTFWLTNPSPPKIKELAEWIGEVILVDIKIAPLFKPTPIEATFQRMAKAFSPYLWGDNFSCDLQDVFPITKEFIQGTIKRTLIG